ncbi:MAG: YqjF family protein [Chitinophagales bacterium]
MSTQQKIFLRAEWKNLLIVNYVYDPSVLNNFLPAKTELDSFEGNHLISLVAFQFLNTKLWGIKFPFHTNFTEINLRFYVRRKENGEWKRGVVFIREVVPKFMITFVANTIFKENYLTLPVQSSIQENNETITLRYTYGKDNILSATAHNKQTELLPGSLEDFITEHYWGFARINASKTLHYAVEHPRWKIYPLIEYNLQSNFKELKLDQFSFLQSAAPHSVICAAGSAILVRNGIELTDK